MISFFRDLFDTSGFPPRWNCGHWSDAHGWLHILSDIAIFGAYAAIPLALAYFIRRRKDVPFIPILWLFAAFIVSCGVTHLIEATIFWHPWYRLSGLMKAVTAVVSWTTVIALFKVLPSALALPGLAKINRQLSEEIAERKRAEETSAQLAAIVESSSDAIIGKDLRGIITSWNAGAEEIFGYVASEIIGHPVVCLIPSELQGEEADTLRRISEGITIKPFETVRVRKDGRRVQVSVTISPIKDAAGKIIGGAKIARDISEAKATEAALRTRNQEMEALLDALPAFVWIGKDPECRVITGNRTANEMTGTAPGTNISQTAVPEGGAVYLRQLKEDGTEFRVDELPMQRAISSGLPVSGAVLDFRFANGRRVLALGNVVPLFDDAGKPRGAVGAFLDITEQRRQADALKESEMRFRHIANAAPVLIWISDSSKRREWFNKGWLDFTGRAMAAEMADGWIEGVHPDDAQRCVATYGAAFDLRQPLEMEYRLRHHDGSYRWLFDKGVPRFDGAGEFLGFIGSCMDITPHKAAEATALAAHCQLQKVLGSITDGLAVLDKDWRYTYFSEQAARIVGLPRERILDGNVWDLFPAAKGTKFYEGYHRAVATGKKVEFEEYYPEPINKWLECHCYPSTEGLSVYFQDVTARKQAEEEMRASNQRMLLATEATGVGIWEWNVLTGEIRWDVQMFRLYGITPTVDGFVRYSTWSQTVLPEDLPEQEAVLRDTVRRAGHSSRSFCIRRVSDGECRNIESVEIARTNAQGETEWVIGTNLDVSERKQAEEARRQNEALFSTLIEQAPMGVYVVDGQFRLQQVNSLAEPVFRMVCPLIGRDFTEVMEIVWGREVGGECARIFRHTLETGERYISPPFVHPRADLGVEQAFDWETQRVTLPDGQHGVVCYFIDVTERRRAEAALREAKEAAETANRSKDHFLAVLSHELRTPLNPVLMTVAALEHEPGLRTEVREDLAMIRRNVELETRLIDDLLDLSRITSGKVELKCQAVDLNEAVRHVYGICRPQLLEKNVRFEVDLDEGVGFISADPTRLQQILWNVIKNAVKFTPENGTVRVSTARLAPDRCEVRVQDSGIGIPSDLLPRIFDAFEQGESHITQQFGGLGLGLAITRALVELQGGRIRAESAGPSLGATFSIELRGQPSLTAPAPLPVEVLKSASEQKLRILIVEDHADTARTLSRLLRRAGFEVVTAADVVGAVAAAEREAPDLLVSDLGLPDGNGYDLMRAVRAIRPLPGIAMSGYGMKEDLRRSREAGFAEHLVKPVSVAELIAAIRRVGPQKADLPASNQTGL